MTAPTKAGMGKRRVVHYGGGGKFYQPRTGMLTTLAAGYPACCGTSDGDFVVDPVNVTCGNCRRFLAARRRL